MSLLNSQPCEARIHKRHEDGWGELGADSDKNVALLSVSNIILPVYDTLAHIYSLTSITTCPSFLLDHERICQHQRRRLSNNSSGPSAWQLWQFDSVIVQRDARGLSHRPKYYTSLYSRPSYWRSFRRRHIQYPTSVCIPYQWYER